MSRERAIDDHAELADVLRQAMEVQQSSAQAINQIDKVHGKIGANPEGASEYMSKKLRTLYRTIIENAQAESDLLAAAQRATARVIALKLQSEGDSMSRKRKRKSSVINSLDSELPRWPDCYMPPLCGSIPADPGFTLKPGHQVAAHIASGGDEASSWILAVIVQVRKDGQYVVEDVMEEAGSTSRERHTIGDAQIIPLPYWEPQPGVSQAFFEAGLEVLALYPQTTCFYPAVVHSSPTQTCPNYQMHFHDDDYEDGRTRYQEVPVRFVVSKP